jgi:hypothetical protein
MLTFLTNNWFVIAGFCGVLLKFGRDQQKQADMRDDISELKIKGERRDQVLMEIKENVAWIRGHLDRNGNGRHGRFDA